MTGFGRPSAVLMARTKSVDDTRALAAELSVLARAGDIVLLAGDLGAGKTAFTQGFARGLGITETVTSPTFTLLRPYEGRLRLLHADIYRLDHLREVIDLGLIEQLDDRDSVCCIEWGDLAEPVLPADFLEVRLDYCDDDDERQIAFRAVGPAWAARRAAMAGAFDRWLIEPAG
ncbi:MAG TPA: tRNA (adenosine(37)-N6)-threonylcarbamoyltransferase complex ATPase subunit type 1 TsaE [Acidimicrobiales bacterium]|nr:tRNA (adenosine(37)-N6)-threonylcarbamoyltransferase complex ATPase subunit type 1 TsaE [Acidimicrobiales bacterium]